MKNKKIIIDGHGGHLCEAHLDGTGHFEVGETVEDAIGRLIMKHPEECGFDVRILEFESTALERSDRN